VGNQILFYLRLAIPGSVHDKGYARAFVVQKLFAPCLADAMIRNESDMEVYVNRLAKNNPDRAKIIQQNITQMKQWAAMGK